MTPISLESYYVAHQEPSGSASKRFHGALVQTNPGLPCPGRDLEALLLRVPDAMPLALLAARHHEVTYYAIFNLQEAGALAALKHACQSGFLDLGFIPEAGAPRWSALHLDKDTCGGLRKQMAAHKELNTFRDESWRDRLGLLLLGLPALLREVNPAAPLSIHHTAVLFSGNPSHLSRAFRN